MKGGNKVNITRETTQKIMGITNQIRCYAEFHMLPKTAYNLKLYQLLDWYNLEIRISL